jgi:hypothetical protein
MSKKITYSCDICRDEMPKDQLLGCHFSNLKDFKLAPAESTDGVHICMGCLGQLQAQMGPKRAYDAEKHAAAYP